MSIQKNIAAKLKAKMMEDHLSIVELSEEIGLPKSSTQGYLHEKVNLRADTIEWLSKKLDCSPAELVGGQSAPRPPAKLPDLFDLAVRTQNIHPALIPLVVYSCSLAEEVLRLSDVLYEAGTTRKDGRL